VTTGSQGSAHDDPTTLRIVDRRHRACIEERVPGRGLLRFAYGRVGGLSVRPLFFGRSWLTRLLGWYADSRLSRRRIAPFIRDLGLDTGEFRDPPDSFATLNELFTRHLRPGARRWEPDPRVLCSPADCRLLAFEDATASQRYPVKGVRLTVAELLGGAASPVSAADFADGAVVVCRLCPADYHRFHFPAAGRTLQGWRLAGRYDSVNPLALCPGGGQLAQNCRAVSVLELAVFGAMAFVEVGAFGVARITHTHARGPFAKMDEKGCFGFGGSTLIMVFAAGAVSIDGDLLVHTAGGYETRVRAGESIGRAQES